jgi:F-type H+-transporting ATPase subunit delta
MKITAQQYARSLYEATKGKSQNEINGVVANFVKVLNKNNQLKSGKNIIKKFGEIHNQENGIVEAEVTSREELSDDVRNNVSKYVSNRYRAKEVVLIEKSDPKIKGGIVIRVGDEVMDGSVDSKLKELKKKLEK